MADLVPFECNIRNSSKPPSSNAGNFINPPTPKSTCQKSGKKRGGQTGREGHSLKQVLNPYQIVEHHLPRDSVCPNCQQMTKVIVTGLRKRQIFGISHIEMEVMKYQTQQCQCQHCDAKFTADFQGVSALLQNGSSL